MTHEEQQKNHRRGSTPQRYDETRFTHTAGRLPSEEWKDLKWYPVSSADAGSTVRRNALPDTNNTKG